MPVVGRQGKGEVLTPILQLAFHKVHFYFVYKVTSWHKVKPNRTKPRSAMQLGSHSIVSPSNAMNVSLVLLFGQRNYKKKNLGSTTFTYRR